MILVIFILYFLQIALVFMGDWDERLLDGEVHSVTYENSTKRLVPLNDF